ncbi:DUF1120 domain-containing protein [Pseudomonas baetica]|uniref:DUF1120 domain-containing protein n=1 Tax=Pseudomonas baetica TaxID=674054 RepID=UPI003EE8E0FB
MKKHPMMKRFYAALSTTALISAAPFALAASSTDLTVKGTLTPSACTPGLSEGGIADYGKIAAKDLNQNADTSLGQRNLSLTVKCEGATRFALLSIDNRADSTDANAAFGLGKINGTQNLGEYMLNMHTAIADGVLVQTVKSPDGETGWHYHMIWEPGEYVSVAARSDPGYQPISVQDLTFVLSLQTWIKPARDLDLSDQVNIDGSATLEMKYL